MKGKNKIMKQWNHQRREYNNKKRNKRSARITANKLELQKKGTEQYKAINGIRKELRFTTETS